MLHFFFKSQLVLLKAITVLPGVMLTRSQVSQVLMASGSGEGIGNIKT